MVLLGEQIPGRLFLDSSTLQILYVYGSFVYDNEALPPDASILRMPGGYDELEALRNVIQVGGRAQFQLALSEKSLREVEAKDDPGYLYWAFEVSDYWEQCLEDSNHDYGSPLAARFLEAPEFGYLGEGDRDLLKDAMVLGCDAFLTMDKKLSKNSTHLEKWLNMRILTPVAMWQTLRPWAALFY